MLPIFNGLRDLNMWTVLFRMVVAFICGSVIGIERTYSNKPAGFRTHILVTIGATIASMTGMYLYLVLTSTVRLLLWVRLLSMHSKL